MVYALTIRLKLSRRRKLYVSGWWGVNMAWSDQQTVLQRTRRFDPNIAAYVTIKYLEFVLLAKEVM